MDGASEPQEWEHWPGRGGPDRPRRGLRALFTSTDEDDAIEDLIDYHGRELEARAASLRGAIHDLEEREERVRSLRASVDALLREGAAELDERHAELALASQQLADREERVARAEAELEERRSELGAVELRRAAVERRETALDARQSELEQLAERLRERVAEVEERAAEADRRAEELAAEADALAARAVEPPAPAPAEPEGRTDEHLLVVPGNGYRLLPRPGAVPARGDAVELDGASYLVVREGRSPLPGDDRRCAYLTPA